MCPLRTQHYTWAQPLVWLGTVRSCVLSGSPRDQMNIPIPSDKFLFRFYYLEYILFATKNSETSAQGIVFCPGWLRQEQLRRARTRHLKREQLSLRTEQRDLLRKGDSQGTSWRATSPAISSSLLPTMGHLKLITPETTEGCLQWIPSVYSFTAAPRTATAPQHPLTTPSSPLPATYAHQLCSPIGTPGQNHLASSWEQLTYTG